VGEWDRIGSEGRGENWNTYSTASNCGGIGIVLALSMIATSMVCTVMAIFSALAMSLSRAFMMGGGR
jgi:hypothetical protein